MGREASAEYGEDLAGVRGNTPKHQFLWLYRPMTNITSFCPRLIRARLPRLDLGQKGSGL